MMHDAPGGLLQTIVAALEAARIPHMVVGSFASTAHGVPRTTRATSAPEPKRNYRRNQVGDLLAWAAIRVPGRAEA